jgi:hypothetical protein
MPWTTPGTATAGQVLTASRWNTDVRDNTQQLFDQDGLIMIRPTSVAGTGVTLSNGKVTFAAASTISVNGCFSSSYDNYRVMVTSTSGSTSERLLLRMRAAGTDASGASTYGFSLLQSATSGAWLNLDFSATSNSLTCGYKHATLRSSESLDLYAPFLAEQTAVVVSGQYGVIPFVGGGSHNVSTSYDGFSLICATGDVTGSLRVYGYRNS